MSYVPGMITNHNSTCGTPNITVTVGVNSATVTVSKITGVGSCVYVLTAPGYANTATQISVFF